MSGFGVILVPIPSEKHGGIKLANMGCHWKLIMHKLNHNSLAYTKRYLGVTDAELEAVVRTLNL